MALSDFLTNLKNAVEDLAELDVITVVGEYDFKNKTPANGAKVLHTKLSLLGGDKVTAMDREFVDGPLASLRDYHVQAEQHGNEIIHSNIEAMEKLIALVKKLIKEG